VRSDAAPIESPYERNQGVAVTIRNPFAVPGEGGWPISMLPDDFVYFCHFTDGLVQGRNDSLVVLGSS